MDFIVTNETKSATGGQKDFTLYGVKKNSFIGFVVYENGESLSPNMVLESATVATNFDKEIETLTGTYKPKNITAYVRMVYGLNPTSTKEDDIQHGKVFTSMLKTLMDVYKIDFVKLNTEYAAAVATKPSASYKDKLTLYLTHIEKAIRNSEVKVLYYKICAAAKEPKAGDKYPKFRYQFNVATKAGGTMPFVATIEDYEASVAKGKPSLRFDATMQYNLDMRNWDMNKGGLTPDKDPDTGIFGTAAAVETSGMFGTAESKPESTDLPF